MFDKMNVRAAMSALLLLGAGAAYAADFKLTGVGVSELTKANLCEALGGDGKQPLILIRHTPIEGQMITVRMYDDHGGGLVTEHNTVEVASTASGQTILDRGFLPPCNTTNGARSSSYRFDVSTKRQKATVPWGDYDSAKKQIVK